jgi:hypothetical protein
MKPTTIAFLTSSLATAGIDAITNTVVAPELVAAGMVTGAIAVGTGLEFVLDKLKEDN